MKYFVLSILLVCTLSFQLETQVYPMMQVEIYSGKTEWGEQALVLTREGLILRSSPFLGNRKTRFIDVEEISHKQLDALNNFLKRHNYLKSLDSTYVSNPNGFVVPRKYALRSYNSYISTIVDQDYLRYQEKDYIDRELLDSLVILTNTLIPKDYRHEYSIKDFSGVREPLK